MAGDRNRQFPLETVGSFQGLQTSRGKRDAPGGALVLLQVLDDFEGSSPSDRQANQLLINVRPVDASRQSLPTVVRPVYSPCRGGRIQVHPDQEAISFETKDLIVNNQT